MPAPHFTKLRNNRFSIESLSWHRPPPVLERKSESTTLELLTVNGAGQLQRSQRPVRIEALPQPSSSRGDAGEHERPGQLLRQCFGMIRWEQELTVYTASLEVFRELLCYVRY